MLMTKFIFTIHQGRDGSVHTIVSRLSDRAQKYFYQASGTAIGMTKFMESMTDELVEGYFPKPGKKGGSPVDNWAFVGVSADRVVVQAQSQLDLTHALLAYKG